MKQSDNHTPEILTAMKVLDREIKHTIMPLLLRQSEDDQGRAIEWTHQEQLDQSLAYYQLAEKMPRNMVGDGSLSTLDFCQYMRDKGLSPIDFILINLRPTAPSAGSTGKFIPALSINQFNGVTPKNGLVFRNISKTHTIASLPFMSSDEASSRRIDYARVNAQDAALNELLDCPTFEGCHKVGLPLLAPRARLFAMIFALPENVGYLAVSPLMKTCREAWFHELKIAGTAYQAGVIHQFIKMLNQITQADLYDELQAPLKDWVMDMAESLAAVNVRSQPSSAFGELKNADADGAAPSRLVRLNNFGFDAITKQLLSFDERVTLAGFIAKTGSLKSTAITLHPLFEYPSIVAQVLREADISNEGAQLVIKHCLASYLMDIGTQEKWIAFGTLQPLIEMYRGTLIDHGYQDIKGSPALDGLVVHLDVAEGFERMGYLRREEMGLGSAFAEQHNLKPEEDSIQTPTDEVLTRKMALAIKLNQHSTIAKAVDQCLMMQPVDNRDLTTREAVLYALENTQQPIEFLLDTPEKIQRALAIGINSSVIVQSPKLKHHHEDVLGRDLGL